MPGKRVKVRVLNPFEQIPQGLVNGFALEAQGVDEFYVRYGVRKTRLKIGAFIDGKMVGFACGGSTLHFISPSTNGQRRQTFSQHYNYLDFTARYVSKNYRRHGISKKLAWRMVSEAKKLGLKGVFLYDLNEAPAREFAKMAHAIRAKEAAAGKRILKFKSINGKEAHGVIRFVRRAKLNRR